MNEEIGDHMSEEMIDVELRCDKKLADKINKMTKKELIGEIIGISVKALNDNKKHKVAMEAKNDDIFKLKNEINLLERGIVILDKKLAKSESYVEQGRAMVESVMERWYHYD